MSIRPYLAVVADSFRAALSSRVLWVAMVMIWLILLLLAPFGYREDFTTTFRWQDFHNGTRMKAMLARGLVADQGNQTPEGRLAAAMPDELKRQLELVGKGEEVRIGYGVLVDALNGLLDDPSWYDEKIWRSSLRLRELRDLDTQSDDELGASLVERRARLRIEAALPGVFNTRSDRSVLLTYGGWDFPTNWGLVVDKARFKILINQFVLPIVINWLLGFAFIFLGILVTASIVPDMLQPGSLHLLLSKPISRTLLLISKFIGGCAFVFLCVCQLILGLYLIAGLRLDIWNPRLLWCIPVSVLMFSVFYSVSVAAGLRWRSAILSISVTVVFGAACFLVGFIGGVFDQAVKQPKQINGIAIVGEDLFASNRGGGLVRFEKQQNRWEQVFDDGPMNPDRTLAPIVIGDQHLVTARIRNGRFNPFGSGAPELVVLNRENDWNPEPSVRLPTATTSIFRFGEQEVIAMNTGELSIVNQSTILEGAGVKGDSQDDATMKDQDDSKNIEAASWLSKLNTMIGIGTEGFQEILPSDITLTSPRAVVVPNQGGPVFVVTGGRIARLEPGKDRTLAPYRKTAEFLVEGDRSKRPHLGVSGEFVILARKEEPMQIYRSDSLEFVGAIESETTEFVTQIIGLRPLQRANARFLITTSDGALRTLAVSNSNKLNSVCSTRWSERLVRDNVDWVHYESQSETIYVVHHHDQIKILDDEQFETTSEISAKLEGWRWIDAWAIDPLRTVIPQTGALGETTASLISGKSAIEMMQGNDEAEVYRYQFIKPIVSCALFILVMMTLNSIYFSTRDY